MRAFRMNQIGVAGLLGPKKASICDRGAANLHKPHALHLSADYPIVIEVADSEEKIREILPMLDEMIADGLITSEGVEIVAYRAAPQS